MLHFLHALNESPRKKVIVRSPSGDTDVLIILLNKMIGHQDKIYLDYGTGLNRKGLWLSNVVMSESKLKVLIGSMPSLAMIIFRHFLGKASQNAGRY